MHRYSTREGANLMQRLNEPSPTNCRFTIPNYVSSVIGHHAFAGSCWEADVCEGFILYPVLHRLHGCCLITACAGSEKLYSYVLGLHGRVLKAHRGCLWLWNLRSLCSGTVEDFQHERTKYRRRGTTCWSVGSKVERKEKCFSAHQRPADCLLLCTGHRSC